MFISSSTFRLIFWITSIRDILPTILTISDNREHRQSLLRFFLEKDIRLHNKLPNRVFDVNLLTDDTYFIANTQNMSEFQFVGTMDYQTSGVLEYRTYLAVCYDGMAHCGFCNMSIISALAQKPTDQQPYLVMIDRQLQYTRVKTLEDNITIKNKLFSSAKLYEFHLIEPFRFHPLLILTHLVRGWILTEFVLYNITTAYLSPVNLSYTIYQHHICRPWTCLIQHINSIFVFRELVLYNISTSYLSSVNLSYTKYQQHICRPWLIRTKVAVKHQSSSSFVANSGQ